MKVVAGRDRAGHGEGAHDGNAAEEAAEYGWDGGCFGRGAFARSRYVVFTTDVELDVAAQDTYVPFTKKIVAAYRKNWKTEEKSKARTNR